MVEEFVENFQLALIESSQGRHPTVLQWSLALVGGRYLAATQHGSPVSQKWFQWENSDGKYYYFSSGAEELQSHNSHNFQSAIFLLNLLSSCSTLNLLFHVFLSWVRWYLHSVSHPYARFTLLNIFSIHFAPMNISVAFTRTGKHITPGNGCRVAHWKGRISASERTRPGPGFRLGD